MGWVEDKFFDRTATAKSIGPLWDSVRDSIGAALVEYTALAYKDRVESKDCTSHGKHCVRIERDRGDHIASAEVFLDELTSSVKVRLASSVEFTGGVGKLDLCGYRLKGDRSGMEFVIRDALGSPVVINADAVCRLALEDFLFSPFPSVYGSLPW